jgi:hypothetical protein
MYAMSGNVKLPLHNFEDDGSDPGNCKVCHFFHTGPATTAGIQRDACTEDDK